MIDYTDWANKRLSFSLADLAPGYVDTRKQALRIALTLVRDGVVQYSGDRFWRVRPLVSQ